MFQMQSRQPSAQCQVKSKTVPVLLLNLLSVYRRQDMNLRGKISRKLILKKGPLKKVRYGE